MAAAYIRKNRRFYEMRVPLTRGQGDGPIRSLETDDAEIKDEIEALVKRLLKKPKYLPLIDAVTSSPPRLSLMDLYLADQSNRLDELLARLDDADLVEYLDGWEKWVNANLGETGTAEMYRMQVSSLLEPDGDESPVFLASQLTPGRVGAWLAARKVSTGYRRKILYALFSLIGYLIEVGVYEHNPLSKIKRPKKGNKRTRWETEANDIRIVDATAEDCRSHSAFVKSTGAEVSAALAIAVREITIWPEDDELYCGLAHVPGTKTETRDRHDVLIEKWARPYLESALKGKHPNALVWEGLTRDRAYRQHQRACALKAVQVKGYTLRDARHSWAVRGRKADPPVSFEAIAAQLGNTVAVVADVYADFKLTPKERMRPTSAVSTEAATQPIQLVKEGTA
jgi:hypothetical protein